MTCIVGYVDRENSKVYMGADSAAICDCSKTIRKDVKLFRNGDFIIGCTKSYRMIQLLQYSFKPPEIKKEIHEYMCTDFVNAIRECFKDGGFMEKTQQDSESGGLFLVGYKDRLFKIEDDFQVGERVDRFDAIGSGGDFALGALYVLPNLKGRSIEENLITALEVAEYLSFGVESPFTILHT